ncbi:MAG: GAF domain-containing protein [Oscillospiraceae bacterium]|nr:GAF domain-containing protein [Oscillospiraceae bacterium]
MYQQLADQLTSLFAGEPDVIANLSNASAALNDALDNINWVGFYRMVDGTLVLGPFQGKVACIRIPLHRGVCGAAARLNQTQLVYDVHQFPGHIACDSASNSEIVIPLHNAEGAVIAVLDIDSPTVGRFTEADQEGLEACARVIEEMMQ